MNLDELPTVHEAIAVLEAATVYCRKAWGREPLISELPVMLAELGRAVSRVAAVVRQ